MRKTAVILILSAATVFGQATKLREGSQTTGALPTAQGGAPAGGATNNSLLKNSATDYDYSWTAIISNTAFASSWDSVTQIAPSKNAVYDWAHLFDTDDDGKVNVLDIAAGIPKTDVNGVVSLSSVTDDAQTKAAIVPNTAPAAGEILIGNAGGTAYAKNAISGSGATITLGATGVLTISAIANASLSNPPSDTAFASSWNGVTTIAPTKNAVYDWGHLFDTDDDGKVNVLDTSTGIIKTDSNGVVSVASLGTDYIGPTYISDTAYVLGWNGVIDTAPSKNAVYDWGHIFDTDDDGKVNVLDTGSGMVLSDAGGVVANAIEGTDFLGPSRISDTAFASSWNGITNIAGSKNAVYDWGHTFDTDDDGKVNVLDIGAGIVKTDAGGVVSAVTAPSGAIVGDTDTQTLTAKRVSNRTGTTTSSATPTINTDNVDFYSLTAQTVDITSFTTNLTGTPVESDTLWIAITGTASRAITWGASFEPGPAALPTTTSGTARLDVGFIWNTVTSKWRCIGSSATEVSDTAFASSWDAVTTLAPSKNAVYDELHKIDTADDGTIVNAGTGFRIAGAAASRKIPVGNGTNFVASTETWPTPGNAGNGMVSDGTNWVSADVGEWTIKKVSGSDATTTGQSLVDVTGLVSDTLTNSTLYEIEVVLLCTTSAVATGTEYGLFGGGTGSAATCNALLTGSTTTNAATSQTISAIATASTAMLTTSGMTGTIVIKGWVTTRSTGTATITIQHLKVTSGTSTVKIGSVFKYRKA